MFFEWLESCGKGDEMETANCESALAARENGIIFWQTGIAVGATC